MQLGADSELEFLTGLAWLSVEFGEIRADRFTSLFKQNDHFCLIERLYQRPSPCSSTTVFSLSNEKTHKILLGCPNRGLLGNGSASGSSSASIRIRVGHGDSARQSATPHSTAYHGHGLAALDL